MELTGHSVLHITASLAALDGSTPSEMDVFATLRHFNAAGKEGNGKQGYVYLKHADE